MATAEIQEKQRLFTFKLIYLAILCLVATSCRTQPPTEQYDEKSFGIVRDAYVIPTSFNESIKTQIKTDSVFIVVLGLPTIKIGSELKVLVSESNEIEYVMDATGNWYKWRK